MKTSFSRIPGILLHSAALLLAAHGAQAAVALPEVFSDHMVLQRGKPVPIWGTGSVGEKVRVTFGKQQKSAVTDAAGKWTLLLDPLEASANAGTLTVRGENELTVRDVLVGEVWLASGQSNMALTLIGAHNAAEVLPKADDPQLRFFTVTHATAAEPQRDLKGTWVAATPETAKGFSAVAYFFARELRRTQRCPVAILHSSWGGTPIETWISLKGMQLDPPLAKPLAAWEKALEAHRKAVANPKLFVDYQADLKKWQAEVSPSFSAAMKQWNEAKSAGKSVGPRPTPSRPEPSNPDPMGVPSPSKRPGTPAISFNAMIAPLAPYGMRGAIWYQGEANGSAGLEYRVLLPRLVSDWRMHWNQGEFPFLWMQLPSWGPDPKPVAESGWPFLREAHMLSLSVPHTGMATILDVGDPADVHPKDKVDPGVRLAMVARKVAYGENIVATGPLYRGFKIEGSAVRVRFTETGGGLTPGKAPWCAPGVQPLPTDKLIGFVIAGEDKQWVEADARIDGDSVLVSSPKVAHPAAVRYGWALSPRCNLYNKEGLPASPFRTDSW